MLSEEQSLKERIKELIIEKTDGQIKVHLAQPGDRLAGYYPNNIVNRLASRGNSSNTCRGSSRLIRLKQGLL